MKSSMTRIVAVRPQDDYTLVLQFNDGRWGTFDIRPYLDQGVFIELKDIEYFKQARIAFGTVQWPHEQDIAPETLYLESRVLASLSP